ncbi:MAG TPA: hypothetical protein VG983_08790 [Caulobacterales bacterium]|nr:hypothetical protein [Caulobacterales bacterium]
MRYILAALAAAFVMAAAPGVASAEVKGTLKIGWEDTSFDFDNSYACGECYYDNNYDYNGPSLAVAVSDDLGGDWFIQGDARAQHESSDWGYGYSSNDSVGHTAIHVGMRNESYAVAGFVALQNWYGDSIPEIGFEAQKYFDKATLSGSIAYGSYDSDYYYDYDAWDAQAQASYYINDTWTVTGGIGYAKLDYNYGDTSLWTYGVGAEYRIPDSRFSIQAAYIRGEGDDTYDSYSTDTFQIGVNIDLGIGTAKERDQTGPGQIGADAFDTHWRLFSDAYYID